MQVHRINVLVLALALAMVLCSPVVCTRGVPGRGTYVQCALAAARQGRLACMPCHAAGRRLARPHLWWPADRLVRGMFSYFQFVPPSSTPLSPLPLSA